MNTRDLRYFVAIAQSLSFAKAAGELNVSASPLSRRIQALERDLGATLFERNTRNVTLTPAGTALLPMAIDLLDRAEQIVTRFKPRTDKSEPIYLGLRSIHPLLRHRLLDVFQSVRPETPIQLKPMIPEGQLNAVLSGALTFGTFRSDPEHPDIAIHPVMREAMGVALPDDDRFRDKTAIDLSDLRHMKLIELTAPALPSVSHFRVGAPAPVRVDNNVFGAVSALILQGDHFALVFQDAQSPQRRAIEEPGIVVKPIKDNPFTLTTYIAWRKNRQHSRDLLDLIAQLRLAFAAPLEV
jgi:DNA-binding transcriptional LysR family regulator